MDLIDRYVNEIARQLPRRQRADVREELRSALQDALESRVDGEPSEKDLVALLEEFGRPEKVAASYRPANRFLIGPDLYPTFRMVVGIVLAVLAGVLTLSLAISLFFHPAELARLGDRLVGLLAAFWQAALTAFAIIVAIFAALQRLGVSPEEPEPEWNPRDLPAVEDRDLVGRGEAVAGIVFPALFLMLLNLFRHHIGLYITPGLEPLLNNVLVENLPWLSVALFLGIVLNSFLLWRGRWHWYTRVADFAFDLFGVYVLFRIATDVAAEKASLVDAGLPGQLPTVIVQLAYGVVVVVAIVVVFDAAKVVFRALTGTVPQSRQT